MSNSADYVNFFLNSSSSVVQLDTFEISHPSFSKVYRIVRNSVSGLTAKLENNTEVNFEYYPLKLENSKSAGNLDNSLNVTFGDLGEILPAELDLVSIADSFKIKPNIIYRSYRSDDLTKPMYGPFAYEAGAFSFTKEGCTFEAKPPSLNINKTGESFRIKRFPMLRGFL